MLEKIRKARMIIRYILILNFVNIIFMSHYELQKVAYNSCIWGSVSNLIVSVDILLENLPKLYIFIFYVANYIYTYWKIQTQLITCNAFSLNYSKDSS